MLTVEYAAIKSRGVVYYADRPARHHNLLHKLYDMNGEIFTGQQGFVLSNGEWCGREVGLIIARAADQLLDRHDHPTQLFSESIFEGWVETDSMELRMFHDTGDRK